MTDQVAIWRRYVIACHAGMEAVLAWRAAWAKLCAFERKHELEGQLHTLDLLTAEERIEWGELTRASVHAAAAIDTCVDEAKEASDTLGALLLMMDAVAQGGLS